jgi:hypothetical protein
MLVMHFVRFSQSYQVLVIGVFEPLKSLMNQDIVYHEITKSIKCDSESNEKQIVYATLHSKIKKYDAGNGKNHKKNIVSFKNISIFGLVMISMKIPHQSVHYVLMSQPSNTFHKKKNA